MARDGNPLSVEARKNRSYLLYGFSVVIMVIIGVSMIGTLAPSGFGDAGSTLVFGTYDGQEITVHADQLLRGRVRVALPRPVLAIPRGRRSADTGPTASGAGRSTTPCCTPPGCMPPWPAAFTYRSSVSTRRSSIRFASYEDLEEMPVATREGNLERVRELLVRERYADDLTRGRLSSGNEVTFYEEMIRDERRFEFISLADDAYPDSESRRLRRSQRSRFSSRGPQPHPDQRRGRRRRADPAAHRLRHRHLRGSGARPLAGRVRRSGRRVGLPPLLPGEPGLHGSGDRGAGLRPCRRRGLRGARESRRGNPLSLPGGQPVVQPDFSDTDTIATIRAYPDHGRARHGGELPAGLKPTDSGVAAAQSDFHTAASELDLTVHTTEWFPINYRNGAAPRPVATTGELPLLAGAANFDEFFQQGFALQRRGDVSKAIRLPDQVIVLSFLDEREIPSENLRSAREESVLDLFIAQARNADLEWWVNTNGAAGRHLQSGRSRRSRAAAAADNGPPPATRRHRAARPRTRPWVSPQLRPPSFASCRPSASPGACACA